MRVEGGWGADGWLGIVGFCCLCCFKISENMKDTSRYPSFYKHIYFNKILDVKLQILIKYIFSLKTLLCWVSLTLDSVVVESSGRLNRAVAYVACLLESSRELYTL